MDGQLAVALAALVLFGGGLLLESRVLLRRRSDAYFLLSIPLGELLVPIPRAPQGAGRTPMVRWELGSPNLVRFWAEPGERTAPAGLRGVVLLRESRKGIVLDVRWAPPVTLVLAPLWLAFLGIARGDGPLTVALALAFLALGGSWYGRSAKRAAAELRWSFLECGEGRGGV